MEIVNRVANSPLVTINLEDFYIPGERVPYDLKELLFMEQILREKDFRNAMLSTDWSYYQGKHVAVYCSADAIIPAWAYMLVATKLAPYATTIVQGNLEALENLLFYQSIAKLDTSIYLDKKVVIKGCGDIHIPESAYLEITRRLLPYVSSIAYGEPCSTVPVYKRNRN